MQHLIVVILRMHGKETQGWLKRPRDGARALRAPKQGTVL